ncbi:MAG: GAF domain-containing protein [Myxococcales bacterium]|nr:GAF domain-containing protein [Myxococcales bacterium]
MCCSWRAPRTGRAAATTRRARARSSRRCRPRARRGFTREEGVAAELAARLHEARGLRVAARAYALEARYAWERWGALAVLERCEREFAHLLDPPPRPASSAQRVSTEATSRVVLDLDSVIKASQILSEEIVYPRLIAKIMATLVENAGATAGALVLNRDDGPVVLGRAEVTGEPPAPQEAARATPLRESSALPVGLVSYVLRTGKPVVVNDATTDPELQQSPDPYLRERAPRAILCAPIIRAGVTRGAAYLENTLVAGCFTDERLETVQILASQAAISIENATLYDQLEAKVRARTRELEEARARAEVASAAKSEFLASMSHELRTPLNAILGYARIMLRPAGLEDAAREGLTTILRSGAHLLELIDDVLDMAKIEARRLELQPTVARLPELLREIAAIVEISAREQGVTLRYRAAPGLPARALVDEKRLRQVLLNLLGNAIKFTPRGEVRFLVEVDDERERAEDVARVRFTVEDTGIGIAHGKLATIFDPFEQAGTANQRARGTGLGLAISQRLVERMGGRIEVESQPGEGSRFWFSLPLARPREGAGARAERDARGAPPPRREHLVTPPRSLVDELVALHRHGDLLRIGERARELADEAPELTAYFLELARRADDFDDEGVRALLERAGVDHATR